MTASERARELVSVAWLAAQRVGAEDPVAIDVSSIMPYADVFLLLSGEVERHVRAVAEGVERALADAGAATLHREGFALSRWVLLDVGDVVVHVFHPDERAFYGLERLWLDCSTLPLDTMIGSAESR